MSGPVHPNKPVTKYRVVNTYDKATATYYGSTVIISARDNYRTVREKIKNGRHILKLPNAPLKAKETMLAECLKARCRPQEFHENERRTWQNQIESAVQQNSRDPHGIVKSAPQLKGKILGIEIEYYPTSGVSIPPKNTLLHVGTDSSLANGGIELRKVTWQNNQGRLAGLCNLKLRGRVDSTCGLHVHVDARHFGTPEWVYDRITECYQPLKMLVPKNRWTSNYCKWVNNREESVCQWTETDASNRYAAVNWYAYNEHGSFEFRCQCGILQPVKIESWALVCQWLTNWVADERNELPTKWPIFLSIMPEPLRSWCIMRARKLHDDKTKKKVRHNERSDSAMDDDAPVTQPRPPMPPFRIGYNRRFHEASNSWRYVPVNEPDDEIEPSPLPF